MKRIMILVLTLAMLAALLIGCGGTKGSDNTDVPDTEDTGVVEPAVSLTNSYMGAYVYTDETTDLDYIVLLNLYSDGSANLYVAARDGSSYGSDTYAGTGILNDDAITFAYTAEGSEYGTSDCEIVDGVFTVRNLYLYDRQVSAKVEFNAVTPLEPTGTTYLGFLKKPLSMGNFIYAYILNLNDDGTFELSNTENTPFGAAISGKESGTYVIGTDSVTFTYDVLTDANDSGVADSILVEGQVSTLTDYNGNAMNGSFLIGQTSVTPSAAEFIKLESK